MIDGRMFRPGTSEIIVGRGIAESFEGTDLGSTQRFAGREWTVVGVFDAGKSGFDSEMWGDVEQMMQAFRRVSYSSTIVRLEDVGAFEAFKARIAGDQRLILDVKQEPLFYEEQSRQLSTFISILGITLSIIFSIGAMIGAMITMYGAVSSRKREVGTLRALGFSRTTILTSFLFESVVLALFGGALGALASLGMSAVHLSMMNQNTWSEIVFSFEPSPQLVLGAVLGGGLMGVFGGLLPAIRAARLSPVAAMRGE
jgi:ABC-type antimicrobial peptide transport system permease subunit